MVLNTEKKMKRLYNNLFSERRINKFLLIGFLGNFILIIIILSVTLLQLDAMKNSVKSNYTHINTFSKRLDALQILNDMDIALNNWQKLTNLHILSKNKNEMDDFLFKIRMDKENIFHEIKEYKDIELPNNQFLPLIEKFEIEIKKYEELNNVVLQLSTKDDKVKAAETSFLQAKPHYYSAGNVLKKIKDKHIEARISEGELGFQIYHNSLDRLSFTIALIFLLGIATCIVSITLSVITMGTISNTINSLAAKEKELSIQNQELMEKEKLLENKNKALIETMENLEYANRELIIINKSLRELDDMKSNFISTVSHELRTPLTSIKGSLGLLLNDIVGNADVETKSYMEICFRNTDRLIRIIDDLLDISKIESGKINMDKIEFSLQKIVDELIDDMNSYAVDKNVTIVNDIKNDYLIYADQDKFAQVLFNLMSNSIKFSDHTVNINLSATNSNGYVQINVSDNGIGIPEDNHEIIFEKFTQVDNSSKRNREGTGLGLAICRAIVEEHQGSIWLQNNEDKGVTFSFTIAKKKTQQICDSII